MRVAGDMCIAGGVGGGGLWRRRSALRASSETPGRHGQTEPIYGLDSECRGCDCECDAAVGASVINSPLGEPMGGQPGQEDVTTTKSVLNERKYTERSVGRVSVSPF
jgi:hypothetical protein